MRSGTENVAGIVGIGEATKIIYENFVYIFSFECFNMFLSITSKIVCFIHYVLNYYTIKNITIFNYFEYCDI